MKKIEFFYCPYCHNLVWIIDNSEVPMVCCGEEMIKLETNVTDGAVEKHVPEVLVGDKKILVKIGSVLHPMTEQHHIEWIMMQTNKGVYFKKLNPGDSPETDFVLNDETPIAIYDYCNLHGLWKKVL